MPPLSAITEGDKTLIRKLARWFLPLTLIALLGIFAIAAPVLASIPQPTILEIQEIAAYENAREDGDHLYIVKYYIAINSTYNADDLFIFRLLDEDDDEIAHATPYPFNNYGYGLGVVAFYLDADEAPDWEDNLSVQVIGNPLVDWDGDPPTASSSLIDWHTDTTGQIQQLVSIKVMSLASELERNWGVEMTTTTQGVTILSDTGAAYFLRIVPYLATVAPYVLGQYTFEPDYPVDEKPPSDDYATSLVTAIEGTIFDLSGPARSMGITWGALTAGIYYAFVIAFFVMLIAKRGLKKGMMLLLWPFVIAGAFIGVPLIVTILGGFLCLLSTSWLIYKGVSG